MYIYIYQGLGSNSACDSFHSRVFVDSILAFIRGPFLLHCILVPLGLGLTLFQNPVCALGGSGQAVPSPSYLPLLVFGTLP